MSDGCASGASGWRTRRTELAALEPPICRLPERLQTADPDLSSDEQEVAMERRAARGATGPGETERARILFPRAADLYVKQIEGGLDGDPVEAAKPRAFVADLLGPIGLTPGPTKRELWAS